MKPIKIGIVEDERITAEDIAIMLRECGYAVCKPAMRYGEAIEMIETEQPDLLLLDINIPGKLDGVDVARTIKNTFGTPFIFLTANSDRQTLARAGEVRPAAFLTKPVTKNQLYAAVELAVAAMAALQMQPDASAAAAQKSQHLFVNDGKGLLKIAHDEIIYAESEENYVRLHLADSKEVLARMTFTELVASLSEDRFVRVHRCFLVALNKVSRALPDEVVVMQYRIPVSKTYRPALLQALGLK